MLDLGESLYYVIVVEFSNENAFLNFVEKNDIKVTLVNIPHKCQCKVKENKKEDMEL